MNLTETYFNTIKNLFRVLGFFLMLFPSIILIILVVQLVTTGETDYPFSTVPFIFLTIFIGRLLFIKLKVKSEAK